MTDGNALWQELLTTETACIRAREAAEANASPTATADLEAARAVHLQASQRWRAFLRGDR